MEVTCLTSGSTSIIKVRGSVELDDAGQLAGLIGRLGQASVVLDLSSVSHIHFRCAGKLRELGEKLQAVGGRLEFKGVSPYIAGIFAVGGFEDIFDFMPPGRCMGAGG